MPNLGRIHSYLSWNKDYKQGFTHRRDSPIYIGYRLRQQPTLKNIGKHGRFTVLMSSDYSSRWILQYCTLNESEGDVLELHPLRRKPRTPRHLEHLCDNKNNSFTNLKVFSACTKDGHLNDSWVRHNTTPIHEKKWKKENDAMCCITSSIVDVLNMHPKNTCFSSIRIQTTEGFQGTEGKMRVIRHTPVPQVQCSDRSELPARHPAPTHRWSTPDEDKIRTWYFVALSKGHAFFMRSYHSITGGHM